MSITVSPTSDLQPSGDFLGMYTEEDLGLKQTLSGLSVTDLNATLEHPRPVPVWFLNPEREERRITYPSITINFMGERVASEREHRGHVMVGYRYLQDIPLNDVAMMEYPIPMDLDYQVTTHARINSHMSQMNAALMQGPLHPRFGTVMCPGGTIRRLEVLAMTESNGQESDKRIFRHVYRVRMPTEIEAAAAIGTRVQAVVLRVIDTLSNQQVYGPPRAITATSGPSVLDRLFGSQFQSRTSGQ
jgi:hypothetical protein